MTEKTKVFDESGQLSSTPFTGEDVLRSGVELKRPAASKATSMNADFSTTFTNLLKAGGGALRALNSGDIVADDSSSRGRSAEITREARAKLADLDATPFDGPQALWTHSVDAVKKGWDDMLAGKFL